MSISSRIDQSWHLLNDVVDHRHGDGFDMFYDNCPCFRMTEMTLDDGWCKSGDLRWLVHLPGFTQFGQFEPVFLYGLAAHDVEHGGLWLIWSIMDNPYFTVLLQ